MKITRIEIKNFVGISELSFNPGKINILNGHKGAGKTSVVEAVEKAFTNKNRRAEVVRHGEEEATIFIQTDDGMEIDRRIRLGKSDYLSIKKPGERIPKSETFLRKLINGEIFRPLEFINKSPDEQTKIILNMLEIDWNMDSITAWFGEIPGGVNYQAHILQVLRQIERLYYEQREAINREIKTLEIQVKSIKDGLPANYDGEYWRQQNVSEYYTKVAEAEEVNRKIELAQNFINGLQDKINAIKAQGETEKQIKINTFNRQRTEASEFIQFLNTKIEKSEELINRADRDIEEREKVFDAELAAEIEKLKSIFEQKKRDFRQSVKNEVEGQKGIISQAKNSIAAKEQEFNNIDQLQTQALESIDQKVLQQIETENARAGGVKTIIETTEQIDIEPLKKAADKVANMQSYLREFERMNNIINEKLAPRQAESGLLTSRIEKARQLPSELIKTAALPIPGVNVDGEGNIRIGQTLIGGLSEGEQLELAFTVAKAQAGELKVICLDGINKINESDRELLTSEMETDDYQYFITETIDGDFNIDIKGV